MSQSSWILAPTTALGWRTFTISTDAGSALGQARQRAAGWRCAQALQWAASSPLAGLGFLVRQAIRNRWTLENRILAEAVASLRPYRNGSPDEKLEELFARISREVRRQAAEGDVEDIEDELPDDETQSEEEGRRWRRCSVKVFASCSTGRTRNGGF